MIGHHRECIFHRASGWAVGLLALIFLAMAACGDQAPIEAEGDDEETSLSPREQRIQEFKDLDLEPGEAVDGIHLMPWIEVFEIDHTVDSPLVSDIEYIYAHEGSQRKRISELTFHGELVDQFTEHEGLLPDDLIIGSDFMVIVGEAQRVGDTIEVEAAPFDIGRLFHGDWDFDLSDAVIGHPEHDMNPMLAQTDANYDNTGGFNLSANGISAGISGTSGFDMGHFIDNAYVDGDITFNGNAAFRGRISVSVGDSYNNTSDGVCERSRWRVVREIFSGSVCIQEVALWAELDIDYLVGSELIFTSSVSSNYSVDLFDALPDAQFPVGGVLAVTLGPFFKMSLGSSISHTSHYDVAEGIRGSTKFGFDYDLQRPSGDRLQIFPFDDNRPHSGLARHPNATFEPKQGANQDGIVTNKQEFGTSTGLNLGLAVTGSNTAAEASIDGLDFHYGVGLTGKQRYHDLRTYTLEECRQWEFALKMGIDWNFVAKVKFGFVSISGNPGFISILTDWANDFTNFSIPLAGNPDPRDARTPDFGTFPPECEGLDWRVPEPTTLVMHGAADSYTNQDIKEYLFADDPRPLPSGDVDSSDALLHVLSSTFNSLGSLNLNRYFGNEFHDIEWRGGIDLRQFESGDYSGDKEVFYLVLDNRKSPSSDGSTGPMDFTIFPGDNPEIPGRPAITSVGPDGQDNYQFSLDPGDKHVVEIVFEQL